MKKNLSLVIMMIVSFQLQAQAEAGPSSGGGGFALYCPENPIEPERTVLLDLYEGEETLRFQMAQAGRFRRTEPGNFVDRIHRSASDVIIN
ncbi:MAG: hypothetical protein JNM39_08295 [Bdellovibrionaceae bacterium]|nr:hypothetical protein [Pseudobdellovibrionaceae bacterium]